MSNKFIISVLILGSFIFVPVHSANAQQFGIQGGLGLNVWGVRQRSLLVNAGVFHSYHFNTHFSFRNALILGQELTALDNGPSHRKQQNIAWRATPTFRPFPNVVLRAGAEAILGTSVPTAIRRDGTTTHSSAFRVNGLAEIGYQKRGMEVSISTGSTIRTSPSMLPASVYRINFAMILRSKPKSMQTQRRWKRGMLPWQDKAWSERDYHFNR